MWRGGPLIDDIFDLQLGDVTEEVLLTINHLDDSCETCSRIGDDSKDG